MKYQKLIAYAAAALLVVAALWGCVLGERMAAQDNADTMRPPAASIAPSD